MSGPSQALVRRFDRQQIPKGEGSRGREVGGNPKAPGSGEQVTQRLIGSSHGQPPDGLRQSTTTTPLESRFEHVRAPFPTEIRHRVCEGRQMLLTQRLAVRNDRDTFMIQLEALLEKVEARARTVCIKENTELLDEFDSLRRTDFRKLRLGEKSLDELEDQVLLERIPETEERMFYDGADFDGGSVSTELHDELESPVSEVSTVLDLHPENLGSILDLRHKLDACKDELERNREFFNQLKKEAAMRSKVGSRLDEEAVETIKAFPNQDAAMMANWRSADETLLLAETKQMKPLRQGNVADDLYTHQTRPGEHLGVEQHVPNMFSEKVLGKKLHEVFANSMDRDENSMDRDDYRNVWLLHQLVSSDRHEKKYLTCLKEEWPPHKEHLHNLRDIVLRCWFEGKSSNSASRPASNDSVVPNLTCESSHFAAIQKEPEAAPGYPKPEELDKQTTLKSSAVLKDQRYNTKPTSVEDRKLNNQHSNGKPASSDIRRVYDPHHNIKPSSSFDTRELNSQRHNITPAMSSDTQELNRQHPNNKPASVNIRDPTYRVSMDKQNDAASRSEDHVHASTETSATEPDKPKAESGRRRRQH